MEYYCVICGKYFEAGAMDDIHTDPSTGGDCHPECCPVCNSTMEA
jgi:hypothetical protein